MSMTARMATGRDVSIIYRNGNCKIDEVAPEQVDAKVWEIAEKGFEIITINGTPFERWQSDRAEAAE